jgi:predicted NBD/HSP70 family sugar kinase
MDHQSQRTRRLGEIHRLADEMDTASRLSEGHFNAFGMLVTDASLAGDGPALSAAQDGLQWLYRRYSDAGSLAPGQLEHRGRLLGLIDTTHWALRRLPAALQLSLDPDGHAARFLVALSAEPGLSNQELAGRLAVDETEVSRVGRRLLAAGVIWRRKQWRRNVWDLTQRGRDYLAGTGLGASASTGMPAIGPGGTEVTLAHAVGVQVLPGALVGVVTDRDAEVLTEARRPLPGPLAPDEAAAELAGFVRDLLAAVPEAAGDRAGAGLGIGPAYPPHGDWADPALATHLAAELGLPTVIENDANALAEFEHGFGALAGHRVTATVLLDEGVSAGIAVDGRILRGASGSAGKLGHIVVEPLGESCRRGHRGCLETIAGTAAIAEAVSDRSDRKITDLALVAELAGSGSNAAIEPIEHAGRALGQGIATLLNLVNPEQLVLYGPAELVDEPAHGSARCFMTALRRTLSDHAFSEQSIIPKPYAPWIGARAAAAVALRRLGPSPDAVEIKPAASGTGGASGVTIEG